MKLAQYIGQRLLLLIPVLLGVTLLTFTLSHVVPGDPVQLAAGPQATREMVELIREEFRLNDPLPVQYVDYVKGVVRLDLGDSFTSRRPVREDLKRYLPATIELALYAFILATVVGVPLGVLSAVKRDRWPDHVARFVSISGLALPVFFLAIMAQFFFFGKLGWLPDGERLPIDV